MANYFFDTSVITRSKGQSIVDRAAYIAKEKFIDSYTGRTCDRRVRSEQKPITGVRLPDGAPPEFRDPQVFLDALNAEEKRCDAQMGRSYILSLPNELTQEQQSELSMTFIDTNFTSIGQGSLYAIHQNAANKQGRESLPARVDEIKANPHLHLIVPFRGIDSNGFQTTKLTSRATNNRQYLIGLRKAWADTQNRFFERLGLEVRVSHESLIMQGIHRHLAPCLNAAEFALERKGVRTQRGDQYRESVERNSRLHLTHSREMDRDMDLEHILIR